MILIQLQATNLEVGLGLVELAVETVYLPKVGVNSDLPQIGTLTLYDAPSINTKYKSKFSSVLIPDNSHR